MTHPGQMIEVNALNSVDIEYAFPFSHFTYPPPTIAMGEQVEEARAKELQIAALEKQQILEFESYLAAASTKQTITEQTSLLLTQVKNISM
jgi:integrator complex subunit 1